MTGFGLTGPMSARGTVFDDKDPFEPPVQTSAQAWSGVSAVEPVMTGWPAYWVFLIGGVLHVLR